LAAGKGASEAHIRMICNERATPPAAKRPSQVDTLIYYRLLTGRWAAGKIEGKRWRHWRVGEGERAGGRRRWPKIGSQVSKSEEASTSTHCPVGPVRLKPNWPWLKPKGGAEVRIAGGGNPMRMVLLSVSATKTLPFPSTVKLNGRKNKAFGPGAI